MKINILKGFTLAEVLITLGIIGIVAAMTIPTLLAKIREKQTVAQVKEVYSIFSQAYKQVVAEYDGLDSLVDVNATSQENSNTMFKIVTLHLKKAKSCDIDTDCMGDVYKNLKGQSILKSWDEHSNIQTGVLLNGTTFFILSSLIDGKYSGQLGIDINGAANPNQLGVDFFHFRIDANGSVIPAGSSAVCSAVKNGTLVFTENVVVNMCENQKPYYMCDLSGSYEGTYNGYGCTNWLLVHENMDYLKKDISNEKY